MDRDRDFLEKRLEELEAENAALRELEKLHEEIEKKYSALFNNSLEMVYVHDFEGRFLDANDRALSTLGYTRQEIEDLNFSSLLEPEDLPRALESAMGILKDGANPRPSEFRLKRKDGSSVWVEVAGVRLDRGGLPYAILGIGRDVTERKKAEQELLMSEERLRSIFNNAVDMIFLVSTDGMLLDANEKALSNIGISREELPGMPFSALIDEHDVDRATQGLASAFQSGSSAEAVEYSIKTRDGQRIWVEVMGVRMTLGDGTVAMLGFARDTTRKKQAEEALRETEDQLFLAQKMEAVGRLAGGVAHDFNNILSVITGHCDLILRDIDATNPQRSDIEEIAEASARAADLTRQLLAFGRRQVLRPEILDLNEALQNLETLLRRLIGEDVEVITKLDPSLGSIKADPGQIEQVVMNLAVNARDAMPQGGKLILETTNVDLDDEYASQHVAVRPGSYVLLAVSDTGEGMDEETRTRLFEPFFTTKEKGKGTGLGLSTVYGIVKQSGGNIWAYGHPGQGTTFKIYLPRHDQTHTPSRVSEPPAVTTGTETILVVEDEDTVRRLVVRILTHKGYRVVEAENGPDAIQTLEDLSLTPQLLVTDVVMPGMSGRELADRLTSSHPALRVLFMSGYTDDAIIQHGILRPGIAYIPKPFSAQALSSKVREVLDAP